MVFKKSIQSPLGWLLIQSNSRFLTRLEFTSKDLGYRDECLLIQASEEQILNYFENKIQTFDVPIQYTGSEFEKRVWAETLKIPFGQTNSYECIAKKIQMPTAVRAVGQAIRKNPIVIIIPCHRIIGKSGKLVGYVGGLDKKRALLDREKKRYFDLFSRSHEFSYHSHL